MSSDAHPKIAVIGAGVIGTTTAYILQKHGSKVSLFDPNNPGTMTSFGNAGAFANYACIPINNSKIFSKIPSLLFSSNTPLSIEWKSLITSFPWMINFLINCQFNKVQHIVKSLGSLLRQSEIINERLFKDIKCSSLIHSNESLYVYDTKKDYLNEFGNNTLRKEQGVIFEVLNQNEIQELEPHLSKKFYKGLLFKNSKFTSNPSKFVRDIFNLFLNIGGKFMKEKITNILIQDQLVYLVTNNEKINFDKIVVCAGAWSKTLCKTIGDNIPLGVERGYHLMYPGFSDKISRPIGINKYGFYMTPMDEGLRVAGTVEIGSINKRKNYQRIKWMEEKSKEIIDSLIKPQDNWLGHRPTLPDSMPIIGKSLKNNNVIYNFGHQHLGLTLAAISGTIIRDIIYDINFNHDISPFTVKRFN